MVFDGSAGGPQAYWQQNNVEKPSLRYLIYTCFVLPFCSLLFGLGTMADPTFGRYTLPFHSKESRLRDRPDLVVEDGRVFLAGDESGIVADKDHSQGKKWIWYQSWAMKEAEYRKHANGGERTTSTVVWCHGLSDYSGKFADHAPRFLEAGYRVIVPDLPSHGRSTGQHAHITRWADLPDALHVVMTQIKAQDRARASHWNGGRFYVCGASLGGFTALSYSLLHRESVHASVFLCPLISLSANSKPSKPLELLARTIRFFAGRLPIAKANRGNNSDDPTIEKDMLTDPQTYHGLLRVSTGLSLYEGMLWLERQVSSGRVTVPFRVWHGTRDRVCNPAKSQWLVEQAQTPAHLKECRMVEGYEHIMLRVGRDAKDDGPRQKLIGEIIEFLRFMDTQPLLDQDRTLQAEKLTLTETSSVTPDSRETELLRLRGGSLSLDSGALLPFVKQKRILLDSLPTDVVVQRFVDRTLVLVTQTGRISSWTLARLELPLSILMRSRQVNPDLDESQSEAEHMSEARMQDNAIDSIITALDLTSLLGNNSGTAGMTEFCELLCSRIAATLTVTMYGTESDDDNMKMKPMVIGLGLKNSWLHPDVDSDDSAVDFHALRHGADEILTAIRSCVPFVD